MTEKQKPALLSHRGWVVPKGCDPPFKLEVGIISKAPDYREYFVGLEMSGDISRSLTPAEARKYAGEFPDKPLIGELLFHYAEQVDALTRRKADPAPPEKSKEGGEDEPIQQDF